MAEEIGLLDVECVECGFRSRREPDDAWRERQNAPDFDPREIASGDWFGDCPKCGQPMSFDLQPALAALAGA